MTIEKMIEKAMVVRDDREAALMAMPRKQFDALRAEWTRKASRKNADMIWFAMKAQADRIAFIRDGGTPAEYKQILAAKKAGR